MQATSKEDAIRAGIIRDAIKRAGLMKPSTDQTNPVEQVPLPAAKKRRKRQHAASAACTPQAASHLPPGVKVHEAEIEHFFATDPTWTLDECAVQALPAAELAKLPLETELASLRTALALSAEREKSALQTMKALRIQLHKAYRFIALQQLNSFSIDEQAKKTQS
jgi:hypothetical protein